VPAGVGEIGRDVADARLDRGVDFLRSQPPEVPLGIAYVAARVILGVLGQAHDARQRVQHARFEAQRTSKAIDVGLAIRLREFDLPWRAAVLQAEQEIEFGAFLRGASRRRRGEQGDE
jgi:hypothetical protein